MAKKKSLQLNDVQKIIIEKCCDQLTLEQLSEVFNFHPDVIKDFYDKSNKKKSLKFDEKNGSVSMTQAQSMNDDAIKHENHSIFNSPKYKDCIHRTDQ